MPERRSVFWACALTVLAVLAYWRAPGTEFIGDDNWRIAANDYLLRRGFLDSLAAILPDRPILMMTILLNHALGGLDPWGYKVFSLVLHIGVGLTFFVLLLRLQRRFFAATDPVAPALFAAVFLVHPLNTQAVLSSIQRGVILAALGGLGSFVFFLEYVRSRTRVFALLALLCYTLGVFSKSFLISLPVIFLLYLRLSGEPIRPLLGLFPPLLLISVLHAVPYHFWGVNRQEGADLLSWPQYLLVQTRVVWIYLKLFLVPTRLHFFYEIGQPSGLSGGLTWLAIAGHGALLGGAALLVRRRMLLAGFGIFAMYLAFLPESGLFPIQHVAFEHRAYFPLLFFLLALFALSRSFPGAARTTVAILVPVAALFAFGTSARIEQVGTLEKWVVDTYRYRTPTRANNLDLLNGLMAEKSRPLAKRYCGEMIARDPAYAPYTLYYRSFTYPDDPPREQRETLALIGSALIGKQGSLDLDLYSVYSLASFLLTQTARASPDPLTRHRTLEPLYRGLLPYFLSDPELFHGHIEQHKANLAQLVRHYESALERGEIPEADFVQYLNVLGLWSVYYPGSVAEIAARSSQLKNRYPGRAALVDGAAVYYRDLRLGLESARR